MEGSAEWLTDSAPYRVPGTGDVWAAEAARHGAVGGQRIVQAGEVEPPADVRQALGLTESEVAVVRRRVVLLDDRPIELADSYYPAAIARGTGLASRSRIPGGAAGLLRDLGHRAVRVKEEVSARMPSAEERSSLEMTENEPVLVLTRLTFSDRDLPMEYSVTVVPARSRRYSYQITVG